MLPFMPTLTRFVRNVVVTAALVFGVMWALATLVEPRTRPMSEPVDSKIIRDAGRTAAAPAA
jgi:hypothetical protein